MVKQRHIGLVIFSLFSFLSARIAFFENKPHTPTVAEERWGVREPEEDRLGLIHGVRYYVYGIAIIGLLMVAEDYVSERCRKMKKPNQALEPTATAVTPPATQEPRQP